jgi:hypothetical protein
MKFFSQINNNSQFLIDKNEIKKFEAFSYFGLGLCENIFFARPVYNEQLYSLIVWSKVALFSPWAKNRSQLKLLVVFFPLEQKTIAYSTFYGTYLFRINFFFSLEVQFVA